MRAVLTFVFLFSIIGFSFGQLSNETKKIPGTWKYKEGSGYDVWKLEDGTSLTGYSYRITKTGDTSFVEKFKMNMWFFNMTYSLESYVNDKDSSVVKTRLFRSAARKSMNFVNDSSEDRPYSIRFKIGFLNRNKMKIFVRHFAGEDPHKYILYRVKE